MKTYEELLSDIEDDIELMGASHIVYSIRFLQYLHNFKGSSGKYPSADAVHQSHQPPHGSR